MASVKIAPVAFIFFNRPAVTERTFSRIREAKPEKLLLICDGPRAGKAGEREAVDACRALVSRVDWPCEVLTQYAEQNMGCGKRVSSGISWVFSQVPEAIILEDDCLPDPSFFRFCSELLERYRAEPQVMMISGTQLQAASELTGRFEGQAPPPSYYFSRFGHIWGWATWARAWNHYRFELEEWDPANGTSWLDRRLPYAERGTFSKLRAIPVLGPWMSGEREIREHWRKAFDAMKFKAIDTWDHQWSYTLLKHGGFSIQPTRNLISNLGFGAGATHTHNHSIYADKPLESMPFPLIHPRSPVPKADLTSDWKWQRAQQTLIGKIRARLPWLSFLQG